MTLFSCKKTDVHKASSNDFSFTFHSQDFQINNSISVGDRIIYVGSSDGNPAIMRMDSDGKPNEILTLTEYGPGKLNDIVKSRTGGIIVAGLTASSLKGASPDDPMAMVLKLDLDDKILW